MFGAPVCPVFNGIEIDMLSLGDADCIVVTQWNNSFPHRVLIDGGTGKHAKIVTDFLLSRNYTVFWAALCTHLHNDHACGLIKIVQDKAFTIHNGWMHDIRKHVGADALRRASSVDDGVKEVLENTRELASAFASRNIMPQEPFAGVSIAAYPNMTVLGPSLQFYRRALEEFTKVNQPLGPPLSLFSGAASVLARTPSPLAAMLSHPLAPQPSADWATLFCGALGDSSVKEQPSTQPYNNTSAILGVVFNASKLLFTGDAGSDALDDIPPDWKNLKWMQVPHHGSDGNLSQANIERFCPEYAHISACGDASHPSRAIVNGLIKLRAQVFSTHTANPGHLRFSQGTVPDRGDYGLAIPLKATGDMQPLDLVSILAGTRR